MPDTAVLVIDKVGEDGAVLEPVENRTKFISQCGVLVRDNLPISIREWHKPKRDDGSVTYVDERSKDDLWNKLMVNFTLPPDLEDAEKLTVKSWTFKKMATQFATYKKNLWSTYKNKKKVPTFTGALEKQKDHWAEFKAYRESAEAEELSAKNKANAAKNLHHHVLGSGGCYTVFLFSLQLQVGNYVLTC